jgi:D-alanyl-lipoteichoic acid acyltransferase DltB (MBOAT superfamily)
MLLSHLFLAPLVLTYMLYPVGAWMILRFFPKVIRSQAFAIYNLVGAFGACYASVISTLTFPSGEILRECAKAIACVMFVYSCLVLCNYYLLRQSKNAEGRALTMAFLFPIAMLIVIKYIPPLDHPFLTLLRKFALGHVSEMFVGISYLSFRLSHVVQEVRNEVVEMPTLSDYFSFAFFVPTLSIGPINPYSNFSRSFRNPDRTRTPIGRSLLRILIGATKYIFLSAILKQFIYSSLILDSHPHAKIDFLVAMFGYTLYLYNNFSGACDMVIGVSGLLGIEVMENFNQPFLARNFQEFWNRWHISLSTWLRDMMFSPLVKMLARKFGARNMNHVIAASICIVFVVIGVWHGLGVNYALFGLANGIGLATVHYSTFYLKKRLGREGFAAYKQNQVYHWMGVAATFTYFSMCLFLFANTWDQMGQIIKAIQ